MDDFLTIMDRIESSTGIKNPTQLSKIINVPQATISRRKKNNQFEIEWAYLLSIQFDLPMEWILKGTGKKHLGEKKKIIECEFLETVDNWISDLKQEDPKNEVWFEIQFKKLFPEFSRWFQRKNGEDGRNTSISKVA